MKVILNGKNDGKTKKRSWMMDKKGINNKVWLRSSKVKYQRNIVKNTMAGWNLTLIPGKHHQSRTTGANDRTKSMKKDWGISGMWQMQVMWEVFQNRAPPLVWVPKASRRKAFQMNCRKWDATSRYKVVYNELKMRKTDWRRWKDTLLGLGISHEKGLHCM